MTQTMTTPKIETKEFRLRYELLTDLIIEKLYALSIIDDNVEINMVDIDIPVDDDGMIRFDVEMIRN
jgi:hypothetical protein